MNVPIFNATQSKQFKKSFILYFVIITVLVSVIAFISTQIYKNTNSYKLSSERVEQIKKTRNDIDNRLMVATTLCRLISGYDDIKEYTREDTSDYRKMNFERIAAIGVIIRQHQNDFTNLNPSISVFRNPDDIVICSKETTSANMFFRENGINLNKLTEYFHEHTLPGFYSSVIVPENHSQNIAYICKNVYPEGHAVYFIINFHINNSQIYLDNNTGTILVCMNCKTSEIPKINPELLLSSTFESITNLADNSRDVILMTPSSSHKKLAYIQKFQDNSYLNYIILASVVFILSAILIFIVAAVMSTYTYAPIRKLLSMLNIETSPDDDETLLVSNEIMNMLSENDMLTRMAENRSKQLRSRMAGEIVSGFYTAPQEELEALKLTYLNAECLLMLIQYEPSAPSKGLDTTDNNISVYEIYEFLSEDSDVLSVCSIVSENILYIAAIGEDTRQKMLGIIDDARQKFDVDLTVAVANPTNSISELQDMYMRLLSGLNSKNTMGYHDIINADDILSLKSIGGYYPLTLETEFSKFVSDGDNMRAANRLMSIFSYNSLDTAESFKEFKTSLSVTFKRLLQTLSIAENDIFYDVSMSDLLHAKDKETLLSHALHMTVLLTEYVNENTQKNIDSLCSDIFAYINDNICYDISINDIVDKFGISASHFSKLIKTNYNITFKKYLNETRMKKAKEILDKDKTIQINDVAEMVGFNSAVSFIRAFKRVEGISPGQYQNRNTQNN